MVRASTAPLAARRPPPAGALPGAFGPAVPGLDAVLHTKFLVPAPRARRVSRPRLLDCLRVEPPPPLTLVAAPAGYGKTTLVADWIATDRRRAAWITLDGTDNDPGAFGQALACALATLTPAAGARTLALLRQPQPPTLPAIVIVLINDLAT
ncbi:MAG TPA: hypothetical protein VM536_06250, partial [Chloroflexia bacterium]|nr:hypothetical protein [Chloroflexia bacterium]